MPRLGGAYIPADPNALTSGESTFPRFACFTSATLTSGLLRLAYFTAQKTESVGSVRVLSGGTAAGATPTLVRFGVYTVASDGALDLVGSTANDTALLATQNTAYTKALSASFTKTAGLRYAMGFLVVTGATAPNIIGGQAGGIGSEAAVAPRLSATLSGQTDLPASIADGSLGASSVFNYGVLVPA